VPDSQFEQSARDAGYERICGIDEAGRGPWAGPVIAAAAVIDFKRVSPHLLSQLDDSKKLTGDRRLAAFQALSDQIQFGLGTASVAEIDEINILQATFLAMRRAVAALPVGVDMALIDGNKCPGLDCAERAIVRGDGLSYSIAAASIIAKVSRDRVMADLARRYPGYGWERNAGYGTPEHQRALGRLGVTPAHRKTYAPIRKILGQMTS